MIKFDFSLSRIGYGQMVPPDSPIVIQDAIAVYRPTSQLGTISVDVYYSKAFFDEGGHSPLTSEEYQYNAFDPAFLALMQEAQQDPSLDTPDKMGVWVAEHYLVTLPQFAGGVIIDG